jgi:hypothetical protein
MASHSSHLIFLGEERTGEERGSSIVNVNANANENKKEKQNIHEV